MQDSRMIAEVVPPGCCAIENVSGSRIATPFAPPSPGSTPMMMPRITPTNISTRLSGDRATEKPPSNALISSTRAPPIRGGRDARQRSIQTQGCFQRPLGQGHLKPHLEDQKENDAHPGRDRHDLDPRVLAQLPHEIRDIQSRREVEAEIDDQRNVNDGRKQDRQDLLQLLARYER